MLASHSKAPYSLPIVPTPSLTLPPHRNSSLYTHSPQVCCKENLRDISLNTPHSPWYIQDTPRSPLCGISRSLDRRHNPLENRGYTTKPALWHARIVGKLCTSQPIAPYAQRRIWMNVPEQTMMRDTQMITDHLGQGPFQKRAMKRLTTHSVGTETIKCN